MTTYARRGRGVFAGLVLALVFPASALAKAPTVSTHAATQISQNTAVLNGTVDPNSNTTVAFFQYGSSQIYGSITPDQGVGAGSSAVKVAAPIGGLAPYTTYHYRIVARYGASNKLVLGSDHTFKTQKQPLGLTLNASPSRVFSGGSTTLSGTLSGTDNQGKQVILQSNPFPFGGFQQTGNPQVVDGNGNFAFPILQVSVNTSYQVQVQGAAGLTSPIATVEVPVRVHLTVARKVKKGKVKFKGRVTPVNENAPVEIQRLFHKTWVTVAKTHVTNSGAGSSFFQKKVKVRKSGKYRALATPGAAYVANVSKTHRVRVTH